MPGWVYVIIVLIIGAGLITAAYFYVNYYNSKNPPIQKIAQIGNFGDFKESPPTKKCNTCGCGR